MTKIYSLFVRSSKGDYHWDETLSEVYVGSFSTHDAAEDASIKIDLKPYGLHARSYRNSLSKCFIFVFEHDLDMPLNYMDVTNAADRVVHHKQAAWDTSPIGIKHYARIKQDKDDLLAADENIQQAMLRKKELVAAQKQNIDP